MLSSAQGMPKPLTRGRAGERRDEGKPSGVQKTAERGASKPRCQANQPKRIPRRGPRNVVDLRLCAGAIHFSRGNLAYNPGERLRPPKVDAVFTDLSHLHTGLRAPAKHYDNCRVLRISHGPLATETLRDFLHSFMHGLRTRACLQQKLSNGQRQPGDIIQ